jgi:hypothetical protein
MSPPDPPVTCSPTSFDLAISASPQSTPAPLRTYQRRARPPPQAFVPPPQRSPSRKSNRVRRPSILLENYVANLEDAITFKTATQHSHWIQAMDDEMQSHLTMQT